MCVYIYLFIYFSVIYHIICIQMLQLTKMPNKRYMWWSTQTDLWQADIMAEYTMSSYCQNCHQIKMISYNVELCYYLLLFFTLSNDHTHIADILQVWTLGLQVHVCVSKTNDLGSSQNFFYSPVLSSADRRPLYPWVFHNIKSLICLQRASFDRFCLLRQATFCCLHTVLLNELRVLFF